MVKRQDQGSAERGINQGENECQQKASKIGPFTAYEYCRERLSPFGGLLGLVKFLDLVKFEEIFEGFYKPPERLPEMGHYNICLLYTSDAADDLLCVDLGGRRIIKKKKKKKKHNN